MFQFAQQMDQARLPQRARDPVVSAPKIGHQRAREFFDEKLPQGGRATRPVDHIIRQIARRETPKPMRFAVDPPATFVGVKHGRSQRFLLNLLVPGVKNRLQAIPHLHQPAGRELHLQMEVEDLDDLRERVAQAVVQPGRKHQHAVAQRAAGQGVGHSWLDSLLALRTPVAMDRVFGDFRRNFRNVLGITGASFPATLEFSAAVRAAIRAVFDLPVDPFGSPASRARMALFGTRPPLARLRRWFLVRRFHARRRGWRLMRLGRGLGFLLGQLLAQFQNYKHGSFRPDRHNLACLLLAQHPRGKGPHRPFRNRSRVGFHKTWTYPILQNNPRSTSFG